MASFEATAPGDGGGGQAERDLRLLGLGVSHAPRPGSARFGSASTRPGSFGSRATRISSPAGRVRRVAMHVRIGSARPIWLPSCSDGALLSADSFRTRPFG